MWNGALAHCLLIGTPRRAPIQHRICFCTITLGTGRHCYQSHQTSDKKRSGLRFKQHATPRPAHFSYAQCSARRVCRLSLCLSAVKAAESIHRAGSSVLQRQRFVTGTGLMLCTRATTPKFLLIMKRAIAFGPAPICRIFGRPKCSL